MENETKKNFTKTQKSDKHRKLRADVECIERLRHIGWACFEFREAFRKTDFFKFTKNPTDSQENIKYLIDHKFTVRICILNNRLYYSVYGLKNNEITFKMFIEAITLHTMPTLLLSCMITSKDPFKLMQLKYHDIRIFKSLYQE